MCALQFSSPYHYGIEVVVILCLTLVSGERTQGIRGFTSNRLKRLKITCP